MHLDIYVFNWFSINAILYEEFDNNQPNRKGDNMEAKTEKIEAMCGGKGHVMIKHILGEKELNDKCGLYAQVTIEPNCTLGYHEHHGESETYYILSGNGIYNDNGSPRPVQAGDITFTSDGHGHALDNAGDKDLVFMALIIFD